MYSRVDKRIRRKIYCLFPYSKIKKSTNLLRKINYILIFALSKYIKHIIKLFQYYHIKISANNDATCSCCSDNASVMNDTHIFSKPSVPLLVKVNDPNFNPKVYPILNIAVIAPTLRKIKPPPSNTQSNQVYPINN